MEWKRRAILTLFASTVKNLKSIKRAPSISMIQYAIVDLENVSNFERTWPKENDTEREKKRASTSQFMFSNNVRIDFAFCVL